MPCEVFQDSLQIGVYLGGEFDTCHPAQASAAQLSWLKQGRGLACGPFVLQRTSKSGIAGRSGRPLEMDAFG